MREIHIHVEEPSMQVFLEGLLPKFFPKLKPIKIIDHRSKHRLLANIEKRLIGYSKIPRIYRPKSLVLIDKDCDDCAVLKNRLSLAANAAGLPLKQKNIVKSFDVVNRIVIEELEAWYFGDFAAVRKYWPTVPVTTANHARYRHPDQITGGTHEAFLRILQQAGYYRKLDRLPKIEVARLMGTAVSVEGNVSPSFQCFVAGLKSLIDN